MIDACGVPRVMQSERVNATGIPLEGAYNFRDVGGCASMFGGYVRTRSLFRCGALDALTESDVDTFAALDIREAVDFRGPRERALRPVRCDSRRLRVRSWDYDDQWMSVHHLLTRGQADATTMHGAMLDIYREIPERFADALSDLFSLLESTTAPLLIACAAGKDRTGVATALVLSSLGVSWDAVVADYLATNRCVDLEAVLSARQRQDIGVGGPRAVIFSVDPRIRRPLLEARVEYLEAAFDAIRLRHESLERYLSRRLAVSDGALARIRRRLLVPDPR
jgi:protein-tyrosine phosphatase